MVALVADGAGRFVISWPDRMGDSSSLSFGVDDGRRSEVDSGRGRAIRWMRMALDW